MLEKNKVVLVFTTLVIQQALMLKKDYTTISVSDAVADYYKKIQLCEENKNFNDSQSDIAIHSLNSLRDIADHVSDGEELPKVFIRTTYDRRFKPKVRRPAGYHRNILLNKSASTLPSLTKTAEITYRTKTTAEVPSTKSTRFEPTTVHMMSGDETTTWVTPWRMTPYANYDSEHERAVQREFPHRKKLMDDIVQRNIRRLRNISSAISYSSESVPSSCECHAGNWSESYNFWEKWKQKQCKPKYLNLQYGLNSEGTEFRTSGEENEQSESSSREFKKNRKYLRGKRKGKSKAKEYSESYDTTHELHNGRKVHPHLQPMGYPQQMGYVPQMGYAPPHLGYPPQMGYAQPMGYPPIMEHPYYPYPMPQYNQHAQYNNPAHVDALSKKLEELHNEIKELKRSTTNNMWEQYLKLKEKFETTTKTLTKSKEITTIQDRFNNYRKLEKQEPYFSKFVPNMENTYRRRPYRTDDMGGYTNQNSRVNQNLYQSNLKDKEYNHVEKVEYSTARRAWFSFQRYSRTEPQDLLTQNPNYLSRKPSEHVKNEPYFNKVNQNIQQVERKTVDATGLTLLRRSYSRVGVTSVPPIINQSPVKQYVQYGKQTPNTYLPTSIAPRVTFTRAIPPQTETTIVQAQSATETDLEAYRKYKELYEFPDYNSEKRRLLRAKEKEMKRKLYAARGEVYDEGPLRITTRPSTTTCSQFYFKNKMEYYKWMFDDQSLAVDTPTATPFNNAPTFNLNNEEEQRKYLKWMFGDKSLEIDPISI